jgi:beta-glucanase (GH16 family)
VIASYTSPFPTAATVWTLDPAKSDEFNAAAGTAPDSTKWGYDTGGGGWGNNELECYTNSTANSYHDGAGNLVIEALQVAAGSACGGRSFTSARLLSKGKFSQQYGRVEASMKLPSGTGIWPAFWMLGDNIDTVNWPACGEVDIMENVLTAPLGRTKVLSSLHASGYNSNGTPVDLGGNVDAAYHIYGMIWGPNMVQFYVDDYKNPFVTYTTANMTQSGNWGFNHPFFIILNVAVGGGWPGPPDNTTFVTPQKMYVDYVRVYNAN